MRKDVSKSVLKFYRSGELQSKRSRAGLVLTAGRCSTTTSTTTGTCIEIQVEV